MLAPEPGLLLAAILAGCATAGPNDAPRFHPRTASETVETEVGPVECPIAARVRSMPPDDAPRSCFILPASPTLSRGHAPSEEEARRMLATADIFEAPPDFDAFVRIVGSQDAARVFGELAARPEPSAPFLYGVCGLAFVAPGEMRARVRAAAPLADRTVETFDGTDLASYRQLGDLLAPLGATELAAARRDRLGFYDVEVAQHEAEERGDRERAEELGACVIEGMRAMVSEAATRLPALPLDDERATQLVESAVYSWTFLPRTLARRCALDEGLREWDAILDAPWVANRLAHASRDLSEFLCDAAIGAAELAATLGDRERAARYLDRAATFVTTGDERARLATERDAILAGEEPAEPILHPSRYADCATR